MLKVSYMCILYNSQQRAILLLVLLAPVNIFLMVLRALSQVLSLIKYNMMFILEIMVPLESKKAGMHFTV